MDKYLDMATSVDDALETAKAAALAALAGGGFRRLCISLKL